jgi:hypothetical protein
MLATLKAFRQHFGLPIQCVAFRSGIKVARLLVIESGSSRVRRRSAGWLVGWLVVKSAG